MRNIRSGFTLIEICVALGVVAIGILTAMSILVPALRWAGEAKTDMTAAEAAITAVQKYTARAGGAVQYNASSIQMRVGPYMVLISNGDIADGYKGAALVAVHPLKYTASSGTMTRNTGYTADQYADPVLSTRVYLYRGL